MDALDQPPSYFEWLENVPTKVIQVANELIEGRIPLLEGIRTISELSQYFNEPVQTLFSRFIGVDGNTDEFPIGSARDQFDPDYLNLLDEELNEYLETVHLDILIACHNLIEGLS